MKYYPKFFLLNSKVTLVVIRQNIQNGKEKFSKKILTIPVVVKTSLKDNFSAFYPHDVRVFQKQFP